MTELNDHELLAEFARSESEAAFATLVSRHLPLVHSAALRFTGNAHHAQEISQAVFIILARKARSFSRQAIVSGWLYQTTRLTAANFMKREGRRRQREQEAYMQSTSDNADPKVWQQIAPLLDDAMGDLGEADRHAVVLRFFENKSAAEVATALRTTEAAAHKRLHRALEKLRRIFSRRGVTLSATLIAGAVSANSVHAQAAPIGLATIITATAAHGTAASASLTTLVKGTMKTMYWIKMKFAVIAAAATLLAGGAATVAISQSNKPAPPNGDRLSPDEVFRRSQDTYATLTSYRDDGRVVAMLGGSTVTHSFSTKLARPNLYRIEWEQHTATEDYNDQAANLKQRIWSNGAGDFMEVAGKISDRPGMEKSLSSAAGISGGTTVAVPGAFFGMNWPNRPGRSAAGYSRHADEKVGEVDCHVFAKSSNGRTITLWIGKQDFLIHQVQTETSAATMKKLLAEAARNNPDRARLNLPEPQDTTSTETHEHIVVNQPLQPADFAR